MAQSSSRSWRYLSAVAALTVKAVFWHSVVLVSMVGAIAMFYAYVVPSWIP